MNDPSNPKSLSQNNVLSIIEDKQGRLWIGTDGGLNYFDRKQGEFVRYQNNPQDPHSISHNSVWRIYEDRAGSIWIGTWGGGLNRFDPEKNSFIRYQNNPDDSTSLSHNIVRAIYEDHNGNLWIGTDDKGLNRFVAGSKVGDDGYFIHYQNNPQDPTSLSGNSVFCIFEDKLGILWIGTNYNGINKYNQGKRQFVIYRNRSDDVNSLSMNTITSICEDSRGMIWIGTNGGGLDCLDRKDNRFTHYVHNRNNLNSISSNMIRSVHEDRHNRLWIGTETGLNYFDREKGKFICYQNDPNNPHSISNNTVWRIYEDRAGNLWIGTWGGGLNRFDYAKGEFTRYVHDQNNPKSISDNFIWTIHEDSLGIFWIGTLTGGFNRFDPEKETFYTYRSEYQNSSSISDNKIISLHEDRIGTIWLGTTNGLNKFDRNSGAFHRYSASDGLPNSSIQGILEDDHGNLWLSTNHGLSKFDPRAIKFKNYFESYGLQSNEFGTNVCCKLKSGEMIFGGVNGFSIFYPDSIRADSSRPSIVITDFQIFNKVVPVGEEVGGSTILQRSILESDEIHLSYKENVFSFEFAVLHYASPKDNLYAYMMEGFENEWNYTNANRRFVTYTNLPGGQYTFRVKASNNQGIWNETGVSIKITVVPPFWKTWWFYGLMLILMVGSGFGLYWRRVQQHLKKEKELNIRIQEALAKIKILGGLIPICANCKKIRDDKGYWDQLEGYIQTHSEAQFTHGICPDCVAKLYPGYNIEK
jgi:ligand-binding sensor domain-containing protein